jgi:hypothetical protein
VSSLLDEDKLNEINGFMNHLVTECKCILNIVRIFNEISLEKPLKPHATLLTSLTEEIFKCSEKLHWNRFEKIKK